MEIPIVVTETELNIAGFTDQIDLAVDIGPEGPRGSLIFTGSEQPPTTPPESDPMFNNVDMFQSGDLYIRTMDGADSWLYKYKEAPGGAEWEQLFTVPPPLPGTAAHGANHEFGGNDEIEVAESQVTGLTTRFNSIGNMLTTNQADVETDTTGFTPTSVTLDASTDYAKFGTKSLKVTTTGASGTRVMMYGSTGAGTLPILANRTYTFSAWVLAPSVTKTYGVIIYWWTSAGNVAASTASIVGGTVTTSSAWQKVMVTGVAPANAAFASLRFSGASMTTGDIYYVDGFQFVEGTGGRFTLPGKQVTDLGTIYGTGSPLNVVVAPVGSKYIDDAVTTGAIEWTKTSGVDSTGWVVSNGDTGPRDIGALITNPANGTVTNVFLRRIGAMVHLTGRISSTAATSGVIYNLPDGWRPYVTTMARGGAMSATDQPVLVQADNATGSGSLTVRTWNTSTSQRYWSLTWPTSDAWPTTLPGS